ncbi:MAG: hydrogenase maturation nickel metallochaperone HypA, partial [Mameliella sp.]|nr:hydrogenase maturation nickel metallochaperone HypA [Phaeodactylibacter sp.]
MHELSIALGVVDIASKAFRDTGASRIESITLEIGELAGVQLESLYFVWPSAVEGTVLEGAERIIETVEGQAVYLECEQHFNLSHHFDA